MKKFRSEGFLFFYYLTLIFGMGLSEFCGAEPNPPAVAVVLLISLFCAHVVQRVLFGWRHFPFDRAIVHEDLKSTEVYFKGSYIPTDSKAKKEKRFLESVYESQGPLASKISMVFLGSFLFLILKRVPDSHFSFATFFQWAAILAIIPVASFSHYLWPLFFSAVAVILSFRHHDFEVIFIPYGILFFATCALHGFKQRELLLQDSELQGRKESPTFRAAVLAALALVAIYFVLDLVVPDPHGIKSSAAEKVAEHINKVAGQVASHQGVSRKIASSSREGTGIYSPPLSLQYRGSKLPSLPLPKGQVDLKDDGLNYSVKGGKFEIPKAEFAGDTEKQDESDFKGGSSEDENNLPPRPKNFESENFSLAQSDKIVRVTKAPGSTSQAPSKLDPKMVQDVQKLAKNLKGDVKVDLSRGSVGGQTRGTSGGVGGISSNSGSGAKANTDGDAPGEDASREESVNSSGRDPDGAVEEPPQPLVSEGVLMALVSLFKFVLVLAVLGFIFWFFTRSSSSPQKTKEPPRLSKEKKDMIRSELSKMFSERLRDRNSIIRSYHIFLKVMAAAEVPREKHIPPWDYSAQLSRAWPRFKDKFDTIAYVFSDAFYGELELPPEAFVRFEGAFKAVIKGFLR